MPSGPTFSCVATVCLRKRILIGPETQLPPIRFQENGEAHTNITARDDAKFFTFEEDKMYTKRESELVQQFLQKKGSMPRYNDELDDLF